MRTACRPPVERPHHCRIISVVLRSQPLRVSIVFLPRREAMTATMRLADDAVITEFFHTAPCSLRFTVAGILACGVSTAPSDYIPALPTYLTYRGHV